MATALSRSLLRGAAHLARLAVSIVWEAPQTTLGAMNLGLELARRSVVDVTHEQGRIFVELRAPRAVSLGHVVFWTTVDSPFVVVNPENKRHEYGHALQSRMLGPLYLAVVGAPSVLRVAYASLQYVVTRRPWDGYYDGFPESWADRLGGVVRRPRGCAQSSHPLGSTSQLRRST